MTPELIANLGIAISIVATILILILGIMECLREIRFGKELKEQKKLREDILAKLDKLTTGSSEQKREPPLSEEHQELLYYVDYKLKLHKESVDNRMDERMNKLYNEVDSIKKRVEELEKRIPPEEK